MKLPSPYRLHTAAAALAAALILGSVPTLSLHADDEATAPAAPQVAAPEAPMAPPATEPPPAPEPASPDASVAVEAPVERVEIAAPSAAQAATDEPTPAPTDSRTHVRELVTVMGNSHLRENESTPEMVTVFGNAQVDGLVRRECVTVLGNAIVDGEVRGECVTVLGSVTVNGSVYGELVCIGGRITLGPDAVVDGEVVSVGGSMDVHPTARIHGNKVVVTIPGLGGWVTEWFQDGLAQARVLPHNHAWAWGAAAFIVALNLLFVVLFREAVTASARAAETRPVFAFINGALVLLLLPVLFVLLSVSVIGIPLIPIAVGGLFLCWFLGTIGIFFFCGQQFGLADRPVLAVLAGNLIFLLLYALPIVGFAVWSVTGLMGLGAAVTAMGARRRETREARAAALREDAARRASMTPTPVATPQVPVTPATPFTVAPPAPVTAPAPENATFGFVGAPPPVTVAASTGDASATFVPPYSGWTPPQPPPMPPPPPAAPGYGVTMPPLPSDELNERATFWPRFLAFVLDLIAVTVVVNMLGLGSFPMWVLSMIAYHVFFWGWRGSTPGGIVLNLQVVRDDRSPMDYKVATVRALSGVFSLVPAGLGLIWVAFDRDSQSWHDKLAGTSVVVVRKSRPLI